jgi:NadR type nicotinamide-nucleotide adenylyltransferase
MEKRSTARGNIIKIAVTGPESTGKSTLSAQLAETFNTLWVPEYAREYLSKNGGNYQEPDLLAIARGQQENERLLEEKANTLLICDTEMIVIKIWSMVKYGQCHPDIIRKLESQNYSHYLLCNTDIPWQEDPLREHPYFREELFTMYEQELKRQHFPYTVIHGNEKSRLFQAWDIINQLMNSHL